MNNSSQQPRLFVGYLQYMYAKYAKFISVRFPGGRLSRMRLTRTARSRDAVGTASSASNASACPLPQSAHGPGRHRGWGCPNAT
eukprot:2783596-Prymnesium_polylepis.1